eukprot:229876_1
MALEIVETLLHLLDKKDEIKDNCTEFVHISDKTKIKMKPICTETEWQMAQDLVSDAFATMLSQPSLRHYPLVSARKYFTESFYAEYDCHMVGVIMAAHWGSIRCIGPLSVSPKYQRNGICGIMMNYMDKSPLILNNKDIKRDVLQTYCASYHVPMYMKYGFKPRFILYKAHIKIEKHLFLQKYSNKLLVINEYKMVLHSSYNKQFLSECKDLTNSIYDGLDYSVYIEGRWKFAELGGSYAMYDIYGKLSGFAVLSYGKKSKLLDYKTEIRICCLVAIDEHTFKVLMFNVLKIANDMGKHIVLSYIHTARIKAFDVMTNFFDFEYDATDPMISMGKCIGNDTEYDDHNQPNTFVIDTK